MSKNNCLNCVYCIAKESKENQTRTYACMRFSSFGNKLENSMLKQENVCDEFKSK